MNIVSIEVSSTPCLLSLDTNYKPILLSSLVTRPSVRRRVWSISQGLKGCCERSTRRTGSRPGTINYVLYFCSSQKMAVSRPHGFLPQCPSCTARELMCISPWGQVKITQGTIHSLISTNHTIQRLCKLRTTRPSFLKYHSQCPSLLKYI